MSKRCSGAVALLTALMLAGSASAAGSPVPPHGPTGQPCTPPHTTCKIVKGKRVCTTTPTNPVPSCGGG
jgi:hypothetical protein